jgi:REP element-mobilizing transposase RayT
LTLKKKKSNFFQVKILAMEVISNHHDCIMTARWKKKEKKGGLLPKKVP